MTLVIAQQEEPGGLADEKCQVGPFLASRGGFILVSVEAMDGGRPGGRVLTGLRASQDQIQQHDQHQSVADNEVPGNQTGPTILSLPSPDVGR